MDHFGPKVAKAFMDAIGNLKAGADHQRLVEAIKADDLPGAIAALELDPAAFNDLLEAIREAYLGGGKSAVESMRAPAAAGVIRFDGRNLEAERWLREQSADLVSRILADQREAIRVKLTEGMARGANPNATAREIVGRVDRVTGKRVGGIIGLTSQQAGYVATARDELASGDPAQLRNYLERARRDKRFDRTVLKAIDDGTAVPADIARKAVNRYEARLLELRGQTIAKVETFASLAAAKHEAYRQAIDSGKLDVSAVTKIWRHFRNEHPRLTHVAMQGKTVGFREDFVLADGTRMQYPHAPGAPIKHTAGCHCQADYRVDFLAGIR